METQPYNSKKNLTIEEQLQAARSYIVRCDLLLSQAVEEIEERDAVILKHESTIKSQHDIIKEYEAKNS